MWATYEQVKKFLENMNAEANAKKDL